MAVKVKWLGHAGFQITSGGGKVIFIDPWLGEFCPVQLADIKEADVVCVTHDHFDHLGNAGEICKQTKAVLVGQPELVAKVKAAAELPDEQIVYGMGINTGGSFALGDLTITMVHAFHSSEVASPCGYILQFTNGPRLYHAGDTGIFASMKLFGEIYPLDLALLPIGGVFTMDSFAAAQALKLLNPKKAIPMHYRTFPILEQDATNFVTQAQKEAPGVEIVILNPGDEYSL